jgi:hypothetical protein
MKTTAFGKSFFVASLIMTLAVLPLAAQTRVKMPKNKY